MRKDNSVEWVKVCGTKVPKKQLEEAQRKLCGLVEETKESFNIKGLCNRKGLE